MKPLSTLSCSVAVALAMAGFFGSAPALRTDAPPEEGWVSLLDGTDLKGWVQRGGKAKYHVEDGQIVGTAVPGTPNSFLCTEREDYSDFILELEFRVSQGLNSGVQVRSHCFDEPRKLEWGGEEHTIAAGRVHGYQVEIDPSPRSWTGGIYDESRRGWLDDLKDSEEARKAFRPGDWNRFRIECRGDSIRTWINDVPAADLKDSMTKAGLIALQVHSIGASKEMLEVRFRNLRLKEIK